MAEQQEAAYRAAREAAAAAAFQPPVPVRKRERRWVKGAAALVALVLAVLGFASYKFVANAGHAQRSAAAARPRGQARAVPVSTPGVLVSPAAAGTVPASPSAATSASASPPPPRVLTPASVAAFGPAGTADGDNPLNAALALSGTTVTPWYSYVYASPDFSGRPPGTGLLLDMGRTVTITSVRVSLDGERGATLQLRAGGRPTLSWLPQLTTVTGAGGTVGLQPGAPVHVRYVLIWFTQLPPDPAGTYQASVYQITVLGH